MRRLFPGFFRRVPRNDEEAAAVLAAPAEPAPDDAFQSPWWSPVRWWDWITHPGRLWLALMLLVIGFVLARALSAA